MVRTATKMERAAGKRPARMVVPMHKLAEKHDGHAKHLCELVSRRQMAKVAKLSKGAGFLCHICGRAAGEARSLCEPVAL
ncbi:MAG: hypothetical protein ACYTF6_03860 [Planctomycetota bacterium]|jgi:hypothetical protein